MEIRELTKEIRDKSIEYAKPKELDSLSASWYQEDLLYSGKGRTIFLILPTPGCSWALGPSGGCTMCSYISDCYLKPIENSKIIELFEKELGKWDYKEDYENGDKIAIKLFASGSFLNPEEVPKEARDYVLKKLADMEEISEIVVESRPEYVKEEVLDEIFDIIGDKLFEISIGLETSNEETRLNKINKGFNNKTFEKAINLIKEYKSKHNIKSKAYIFVKPILLSDQEAIKEAIETASYCEDLGVDRVSCCPATIHRGTLIERLWRRGSYNPPWIWSTIEVINTIRQNVKIPALMDTSGFGSRRGPYNCKKCNKELKHRIIDSNFDQSQIEYDCECKKEWIAEVKFSDLNKSKTPIKHLPLY